jgi:quercetin dioxygenase-like cupin family protein
MDSIKLPFKFNSEKIKEELAQFSRSEYDDIYNPSVTLETLWLKHFIEPKGGPNTPVVFYPNEALEKCPYLLSIFKKFQCRVETFRIHALDPGASIKPHTDSGYSFQQGKVRLHIPVQTNDEVKLRLGESYVRMKEGDCWYCDFTVRHEIHNQSDESRIHLILDCMVNEWLKEVFENAVQKMN